MSYSQHEGNGSGKYIPTDFGEDSVMILNLKPRSVTEEVYGRVVDFLDLSSELPDYCHITVTDNTGNQYRLGIGNENALRLLTVGGQFYFEAKCPSDVEQDIKLEVERDALSGLHEILKEEDCLKRSKSLDGLVSV